MLVICSVTERMQGGVEPARFLPVPALAQMFGVIVPVTDIQFTSGRPCEGGSYAEPLAWFLCRSSCGGSGNNKPMVSPWHDPLLQRAVFPFPSCDV